MSTMNCDQFLTHIDEWIEGQEVPGARDHSRVCAECRGLAEDLGTIRLGAVTLPEADPEISPRVWKAIRAQLQEEGLIRPGTGRESSASGWLASLFSFLPRPAFAAGYVIVLVAVGLAFSGPKGVSGTDNAWRQRTQSSTAELSAQLETVEQGAMASLASYSPAVTDDLRRNLTIVDNDIALCEKSVREEPDSEIARDYLYSAYQQKADLLARISENGDLR